MNSYIKKLIPFGLFFIVLITSCSDSKTTKEEQIEISKMDSTSKAVKTTTDKLDEQTKKVEEALEKMDKEFDENK